MAAPPVLRNIRSSVTMTAANDYTESEINLALSLESSYLYFVTAIDVQLVTPENVDADTRFQWQLCRKTATAIGSLADAGVLWSGGFGRTPTGTGVDTFPLAERIALPHPYAIANDVIYFGVDAGGNTVALQAAINISYYPQKVSQSAFWQASTTR